MSAAVELDGVSKRFRLYRERPSSVKQRLLVTRSDGVRLVAARTADGGNACLVIVLPVGRPGVACTELGRFPADGLRAEVAARAVGEYVAIWYADGRVTINAAAVPSG